MSAIQTLRNKSGLITLFIGIALLAFVVTGLDPQMFSSMKTPENVIAEINNTEYQYESYYSIFEQVEKRYKEDPNIQNPMQMEGMYDEAWQIFLNSKLFENQYVELGMGVYNPYFDIIGVTNEEIMDRVVGENIDREILMNFTNPQTGQFDKQMLIQILSRLQEYKESDPRFYYSWLEYEKSLHKNSLQTKYLNLITKAVYVTALEAEMAIQDKNAQVDIEFVKVSYETISDESIKITDADIAAHYEKIKHKKQYEQEHSLTLEYLTFDITPTQKDVEIIRNFVTDKADDFQNTKNNVAFLNLNSDIKFNKAYYKKGDLPGAIDSFAFASTVNSVTPMYLEGNTYKVAKLSDVRFAADSARVRHILINSQNAKHVADSIKELLEKGADFASLARKHSADSGSAITGGVIDWFKAGEMVESFQDTSFYGEKGKFYIAPSQFGLHIIEILEQGKKTKRVQVQYLAKNITYSQETRKAIYKEAVTFASENRTKEQFSQAIAANNAYSKRIAEYVSENQRFLPGLVESRAVIRWAFQNLDNKNQTSEIFTCGDKFVIATIAQEYKKGIMPLDLVKDQVKTELLKEKKKEQILLKASALGSGKSLQEIAAAFNVEPQASQNITFAAFTAPEVGVEPKVFAYATILEKGSVSPAIDGNGGVFFIKVVDTRMADANADVRLEKMMQKQRAMSSYSNAVSAVLKDKANVKDYRISFN